MPREILFLPAPQADLRVPYGEQPSQFIDYRFPASPAPGAMAVMVHGGFWRARFDLLAAGHLCAALTAAGLTTANIEYRRVGEPGGGWPGTLEDVRSALHAARSHPGGGRDCIVIGHSAGGHLALWLAGQEPDLAGAFALAPVACLRTAWEKNLGAGAVAAFLGGLPEEVPERYMTACPSQRPALAPCVLIHGIADDIVPQSQSRDYLAARSGDPVPPRLVELPGADHFDVIDPRSAAWGRVFEIVTSAAAAATTHQPNQSPKRV